MKTIPCLLFCASVLAAPVTALRAELVAEVPVVELKPKPEDEVINTTFVFHNKGTKPVQVTKIDSACSCLSASLDKAVYQPGEKGVGKAEFRISSFTGRHEKTVHILTDDPAQPEWVVKFAIEVPEVVKIEPKTLQWWVGDPADTKTTRVTITGDVPMKVTQVTSTRDQITWTVKEITPGKEYEVTVTPKTTGEVLLGALKIETDSAIQKYKSNLAFFSIYRKPERPTP